MRAILIDDEPLALDFLELQLKKASRLSIVGKFTHFNIEENMWLIRDIDVVFLDIDMPYMSGIKLAQKLQKLNSTLTIIFVTAHNDYATEAFELQTFDYVLKPIQLCRLRKTCERIEEAHGGNRPSVETEGTRIRIRVSGELTFELPDGSTDIPKWRTAKIRELFLYLLHVKEKSIHKSELVELLWTDIDLEKGHSRLYTAIYHIRKTLQPYSDHLVIHSKNEGYSLQLKDTSIDLTEWEQGIASFSHLQKKNVAKLEELMELYRGPYLASYDFIWLESERFRLEQIWLNYAQQIAHFFEEQNMLQRALHWYDTICRSHPYHENSVLSLLKSLDAVGNRHLLIHQHKQYIKAMEELNIEPGQEITDWYASWSKINKVSNQNLLEEI